MIRSMAATLSCSLLTGTPSYAVSSEGQFIDQLIEQHWLLNQQTRTLGRGALFDLLEELAEECSVENWDGYGAMPVSRDTRLKGTAFLRSLPDSRPSPSLGVEPDGQLTFEWHVSPKRTLSVSVSPDGLLHYAALIGSRRHFGTIPFLGDCPAEIVELIDRVERS